jgi:regulator of sigma E protease
MPDTVFPKRLNTVFLILDVPLIFTLLIVSHEPGHFLAARWRGFVLGELRVRFGKLILRKRLGAFCF